MRVPQDISKGRRGPTRLQLILIAIVVVALVVIFSLKGIAVFYTDYLWFANYHLGEIWSGVLLAKVELWFVFAAIFFAICYASLTMAHRATPKSAAPDDDLVQRYREMASKHPYIGRITVTVLAMLIVASEAPGQWKHWLLFRNYVAFPSTDPEFHKNAGFFVFQLPFIEFLISWVFFALAVTLILTVALAYLNGSIRLQGRGPHVTSRMKAHLSVILAAMALDKAIGYYYQRFTLDMSTRGVVEGASYTDVHASLPAINLLIFISIVACLLFVYNIYRQGWVLPVLGLGLWMFIAIVLGAIYPAIIQKFTVDPAQGQKELPYIARDITATRYAMNIGNVGQETYTAGSTTSAAIVDSHADELAVTALWGSTTPVQTVNKLQDIRSYYQVNSLSLEDYLLNGRETPVIIGVRELDSANLPAKSWVNEHLQFTHGYGVILAQANEIASSGNPDFDIKDLPGSFSDGAPKVTQPQVYYGTNISGYVIANTKQPEIDYQTASGASVETHYHGTGGVQLSSLIKRAAFALRFGDINILFSSLVTPQSRIMFERDITARAEMAMPFLEYGSHPYPVIAQGKLYWVVNGYTTSNSYPYAEEANTSALSSSSSLANTSFNYIRQSVKVVVNAYTGSMNFYVDTPHDPLIESYEKAFPHVFKPLSAMPAAIRSHLRYPSDLLAIQSAMYGLYHVTNASNFYSAGNAWDLSASPDTGPITSGASTTSFASSLTGGSGSATPMAPDYQMVQLPSSKVTRLGLVEAYVPESPNQQEQNLTGLLVGETTGKNPFELTSLVTPSGEQVDGPALVSSRMLSATNVSQEITLLDQHGSEVQLGSLSSVPLGQNLLWIRPLYVESATNAIPEIKEVIGVYGTKVVMEPTYAGVLNDLFGQVLPNVQGSSKVLKTTSRSVPASDAGLVKQAQTYYSDAQTALKNGNLSLYQQYINDIGKILSEINTGATSTTAKS